MDRLAAGEWIADLSNRKFHGYHLSRLFSPRYTIDELTERFFKALGNDSETQRFYNASLGEPYTAVGAELTAADMDAIRGEYMPLLKSGTPAVVGIDIGSFNYYQVVELKTGRLLSADITNWPGLDRLYDSYNLVATVIDALPETSKAKELARRHPNVWLATYPADMGAVGA